MSVKHFLVILLLMFPLVSCGGGGGGSGSSSSDAFGIRVLHGAIEGTPVEFTRPGSEGDLRKASFLDESFYVDTPAGSHIVGITTANSGGSDLLVNASISIEERSRTTLFLFGDQSDLGLRVNVLNDRVEGGGAAIRILNGVDSASSLRLGMAGLSSSQQQLPFGESTGYVDVTPGEVVFSASRNADGLTVASGVLTIEDGAAYTLVIAGEAGVFVTHRLYAEN